MLLTWCRKGVWSPKRGVKLEIIFMADSMLWEWHIKVTLQDKHPLIGRRHCSLESIKQRKASVCGKQMTTKEITNTNWGWGRDNILSLPPPAQSMNQGCSWGRCFIAFPSNDIFPGQRLRQKHIFFQNYLHNKKQHPAAAFKLYLQTLASV